MSEIIPWMAAEADRGESPEALPPARQERKSGECDSAQQPLSVQHLPVHQFPATGMAAAEERNTAAPVEPGKVVVNLSVWTGGNECVANKRAADEALASDSATRGRSPEMDWAEDPLYNETDLESDIFEQQRRRRVYRGRTAAMLHRYMRYALETGRIPSILGGDIFRSRVTSYGVSTFEDRAIFVHDMERCLQRLDELSQQVVARVVLQGHNREEAARLIGCTSRTIHRNLMEALDRMADILLEVGLLEELPVERPRETSATACSDATETPVEKSCQGGEATDFLLSDCEDGK